MIQLPDGSVLGAACIYEDGWLETSLFSIDEENSVLLEELTLPSGGENGYPDMVIHDGQLWVSYYSRHDGKASIYIARVDMLLSGDANGDGMVNDADATIMAANWQTGPDATWAMGDFNNDGTVDNLDAMALAANWLKGAKIDTASGNATVPEPSTWWLLGSGLIGWMIFARRQRERRRTIRFV